MIFSCVGYESLIVSSMEYDHSFIWKYKSKDLVPMNKFFLCKVKSTDSDMHGQR